ncbi:MAG: hypothetical protein ACK5LK_10360 [Chthoniobacterales bacterium]
MSDNQMYDILSLKFRKAAAILLASSAALKPLAAESTAAKAGDSRPNIVFIFSDDHTCQAISAYGDERKLIETPPQG